MPTSEVPRKWPSADPTRHPIPSKKRADGALEGESLKIVRHTTGNVRPQEMTPFRQDQWSGDRQLFWTGAQPDDTLELEIPAPRAGRFHVELVLTNAPDYAVVQLLVGDVPLGGPIDLFNEAGVVTTGVLTFEDRELALGANMLTIKIVGAHPRAIKSYMVGLDYVRLVPAE